MHYTCQHQRVTMRHWNLTTATWRTLRCYLIWYLHLDTYFVDWAYEMYQKSCRRPLEDWKMQQCACVNRVVLPYTSSCVNRVVLPYISSCVNRAVLPYISALVGFPCLKLHFPTCLQLHLHPHASLHTLIPVNTTTPLMLITTFNSVLPSCSVTFSNLYKASKH
jgi:hypothetical protein